MTEDNDVVSGATKNPYDVPDTCQCCAWSEGECGCGGYVDLGKVRAWQQGYDAAVRDLGARGEPFAWTIDDVAQRGTEEFKRLWPDKWQAWLDWCAPEDETDG